MIEIFRRMFYGGFFVGLLTGIALMCVIGLIILKIEYKKEDKINGSR